MFQKNPEPALRRARADSLIPAITVKASFRQAEFVEAQTKTLSLPTAIKQAEIR